MKALLGRETRNLEKNPSLVQLVGLEPVASHTTVECFNHLATQLCIEIMQTKNDRVETDIGMEFQFRI